MELARLDTKSALEGEQRLLNLPSSGSSANVPQIFLGVKRHITGKNLVYLFNISSSLAWLESSWLAITIIAVVITIIIAGIAIKCDRFPVWDSYYRQSMSLPVNY